MNADWTESFVVRSYEVDVHGLLRPQTIVQFFQEAAANHASHLGVGYTDLRALGMFWALSRIKIEILSLPAWGDPITVMTWPKGWDRLFALRDFRIDDRQGRPMIRGTSCWLLVDVEKLRPRRSASLPQTFPINEREHALRETLGKISVPGDLTVRYERQVMTGDLDVNKHVNNTEYVRWITDCLEADEKAIPSVRTLQINYLDEARLGETIVLALGHGGPTTRFVEAVKAANGVKVVQSRVELSA